MEEGTATHFSILAWRISGTEEPGGLPSMGSQRVRHDCSDLACTSDILTALGRISMVHAHCLKQTLSQEREISAT